MRLTPNQERAINARGSDVFVVASAGSGKTETLAERCAALILGPGQTCDIDQVLVVTFTRAAAAELRTRIARKLVERSPRLVDSAARQHFRRQMALLDAADICTIDAWCQRLVREHFAAAGVDPGLAMLGENGEAELLRNEVMDQVLAWVYADPGPEASAARNWLKRNPRISDDFLREMIAGLSRQREHLLNPAAWLQDQATHYSGTNEELTGRAAERFAQALRRTAAGQIEALERLCAASENQTVGNELRRYLAAVRKWSQLRPLSAALQEAATEIDNFVFARKPPRLGTTETWLYEHGRKKCFADRIQKAFAWSVLKNQIADAPQTAALIRCLLDLEARYFNRLQAVKRQRGVCEFGDMLRLSLDLLSDTAESGRRTPSAIARKVAGRYQHILVDEFQDTSPVQVEIVRLIARADPGNRFLVGDIKQSIYGFREAEPRLFAELIQAAEANKDAGQVLPLNDSFRTHADLLTPLNQIFARLFDPALGGRAYGETEWLHAAREEIANPTLDGRPRWLVHVIEQARPSRAANHEPAEEPEQLLLERAEREALAAAPRMRELVEGGVQIPERGPDRKMALRPIRYGDMVVLLRAAHVRASQVARQLRSCGIPSMAVGRESLLDCPEVTDLRCVLTLLSNRRQDLALAAYLRGPLVCMGELDLLMIRRSAPTADFADAVLAFVQRSPKTALSEQLARALARLDEWSASARDNDVATVLARILGDSGHALFAAERPGGEFRVAMIRSLLRFAEEFDRTQSGGPGEFADFLDEIEAEQKALPSEAVQARDAVRVMTIHQAKGLEFPVVFLMSAGVRFNTRGQTGPLLLDEQAGIGFSFLDGPLRRKLTSAARLDVIDSRRRRELDEELRLLYVAATRARERFYVIGHSEPQRWSEVQEQFTDELPASARLQVSNHLEWVLMAAAGVGQGIVVSTQPQEELRRPKRKEPEALAELTPTQDEEAALGQLLDQLRPLPRDPIPAAAAVVSVSQAKQRARGVDQELPDATVPLLELLTGPIDESPDGRTLGAACHRFLQFCDLSKLANEAGVAGQIEHLAYAGRLTRAEVGLLPCSDLAWLGGTPLGQQLGAGVGVRREVAFTFAVPWPSVSDRMLLRGVIDCIMESPDGLTLIDYKTDLRRSAADWERRIRGYAVQLQLYALAAAEIFAKPVQGLKLVFLRHHEVVEVPVVKPSLAQLFAPAAA